MSIYNLDYLVSIKPIRKSYERRISEVTDEDYYITAGYIVENRCVYTKPRVIFNFLDKSETYIEFNTYEDACDCAKKLGEKIKNKIEI